MNSAILPPPNSHTPHARPLRRLRSFLRSYGLLRASVILSAFILATLILYTTFSPASESTWSSPLDWHKPSRPPPRPHPEYAPEHATPNDPLAVDPSPTYPLTAPDAPATSTSAPEAPPLPSRTPLPDVLTLEQIRDIVAPTRGFFSRDYSLGLGWNNVSCPWRRFGAKLTVSLTDAVYHRRCRPPSRIAQSHVGPPFVRLRARMRVLRVRCQFSSSQFQFSNSLSLSSAARFVRTMQLWSTKATP